ncbi:sulfurtransferase [Aurantimonas endophytica]|nr:sulfurtransferase [Aurantimonas endophytica]
MKDFVAEARAVTGVVQPDEAHRSEALILDVREAHELADTGRIDGAVHVPRGFLEARADPTAESVHPDLAQAHGATMPVYILCASGARAALAAKTLTEMGYDARPIEGGIQAWRECGLPVAD